MKNLKICRVCLIIDVRMYDLAEDLKQKMSFLFENDVNNDKLPLYICFECKSLLEKFNNFKRKCEVASEILLNMIDNGIKITKQTVTQIDRSMLQSKLSCNVITNEFVEKLTPEQAVQSDKVFSEDTNPLKGVWSEKIKFRKKKIKSGHQSRLAPKCNKELKPEEVSLLNEFTITPLTLEEQQAQILKRKETSNYHDSPYKCEVCYKGFLQEGTWRNHEKQHDPMSGNLICPVCGIRRSNRRGMKSHLQRHAKLYSCLRCQFFTQHLDSAKKHKQWHNGVTYKCQHCNEVFIKLSSQLSHTRLKHPSEHVCVTCGDCFVSERGLAMHNSRMHSKDKESSEEIVNAKYYCDICNIQFVSMAAKTRHGANKHNCIRLNIESTHREKLKNVRRHLAKIRRKRHIGLYPVKCELCPEMIPDRRHHWRHYQRCHQNIKYPLARHNFICEICGKGFQGNAFLIYHQRRHLSGNR